MRKIFFLSIILFLLVGCTKSEPIEQVKINQLVLLSDEPKAIKVTVTISDFEFANDVNDIEIGIIYKQNAMIDEVNNFSIDTLNITKINQVFNQEKAIDFYISNILEEDYQKMFTIRAYLKYQNGGKNMIVYADNTLTNSPYELALNSSTLYAEEIKTSVEQQDLILNEIEIQVNTSNYTVIPISEGIKVTILTDYKKVTVKVETLEGYIFNNPTVFIFNEQILDIADYTISQHQIIYFFDDPNWSGIY